MKFRSHFQQNLNSITSGSQKVQTPKYRGFSIDTWIIMALYEPQGANDSDIFFWLKSVFPIDSIRKYKVVGAGRDNWREHHYRHLVDDHVTGREPGEKTPAYFFPCIAHVQSAVFVAGRDGRGRPFVWFEPCGPLDGVEAWSVHYVF